MILRRIAHHLKQQQWTAVLIELVILILGVFLGFQVTDWANERANRSAEVRHLEEIAEDLRADAAVFDQIGICREAHQRHRLHPGRNPRRDSAEPSRHPDGDSFDMPAGPPIAPADRTTLLGRVNARQPSVFRLPAHQSRMGGRLRGKLNVCSNQRSGT